MIAENERAQIAPKPYVQRQSDGLTQKYIVELATIFQREGGRRGLAGAAIERFIAERWQGLRYPSEIRDWNADQKQNH